ncbi:MAG: polysaccharide biosynthesis protein [Patescibacteria group bacterium]|uniref:lipopolysaccharide biosynthesis protein n=1 Tax=Caldilinea sp. TaxID=2293560 RepID=UPI0021DDD17C|nr:oligosaccharide flippase family protein [Caldilinea sp.]GIV70502.1 MAG: polysaccharide biosynthesis protein [Caldilinea sp.]GIW61009.1 MAG: polysaccharide biosynthesis protein [Patescibacteria group bacterium]
MTETSTIETSSPRPHGSTRQARSGFGGDVLKLVSGTTFAQALLILAAPILTRLYPPEAFGVLAIFTSITTILGVIACLRYELAITLPEKDEDAANVLGVTLFFAVLIALLASIVIGWGHEFIIALLKAPALGSWLWLVPPATFLAGVFLGFNYWNTRTHHFGRLSISRVLQSASTATSQITLGLTGVAPGGALIISSVGGQALAVLTLGMQIYRDDRNTFWESVRLQKIVEVVKRYRKFPLYDTWSALLNSFSWQLPAFLLAAFFSPTVVGYYALGFRILQMPMSLVGSAIAQVFYPRAAEAYQRGDLSVLVENTFHRLVLIGLFPMLTLTLIGRDLFTIFFGPEWAEAGSYAQILSIWAFVWFISSPLSTIFNVLEKQERMLRWNMANFLTRFLSLWIGGVLHEPRISIFLFAATGLFVYGYINYSILSTAGVPLRNVIRILLQNALLFLPAGATFVLMSVLFHEPILVVAAAVLWMTLYTLYVLKTQMNIFKG